ncbi:AsmA family protein [Alloacidobacterium dinghuense]|uniref:AsmA family protein n=1 Tax=Alloacidobacterium dinghuense TaxID=2763107 RepID=A0A7G8BIU8_9BACT|nr:AsmA family protein [Alloacidobacterium dinghuense]QNI32468.1 AsmA family protein [Alloacidobacterium dinghuense]
MNENPRNSRAKYWVLFATLLLLAAALILPPLINMNRYQRRIADAIGAGLGRRVHLSSVTLRLLPRPGLELSDFIVEEDPAFGAEPTLRASSVDASMRLMSLWRGRLEIGRISFDQPSLNLVRNSEGRWNIATMLLQASRIPNAPTAQRRVSGSPRFPYIEASNARVNFKIGNEKKPFSFLNADFAMWLANPDEWRLRFEAQPLRTDLDLDLSDTGRLRLEGSLHRTSEIGSMPVDLQTEWSNAPLGQLARLLLGRDTGWRGSLDVTGTITGSLFNPQFKSRIQIAGMHRQEFAPLEPFNVDATCQGNYAHESRSLENLTCLWPIDGGHLLLTGTVPNIEHPQPGFNLQIQNVPAAFGLSALRLVRSGFASSTQVSGVVGGNLVYSRSPVENLTGEATVNGLAIRTPGMDAPLVLPTLHVSSLTPQPARKRSARSRSTTPSSPVALHLATAGISLGEDVPLNISGDFTRQNFSLRLSGNASLERVRPILAMSSRLHNAALVLGPQGSATLDLTVRGPWLAPAATPDKPTPSITTEGSLRLRNATYQASFLPEPVEIISAQAAISATRIIWNPVSVVFHKIPATLSVTSPIPCAPPGCVRAFSLSTPQLDAGAIQSTLMGAGEHGEFLQQILARLDRNKVQWPALDGTIRTATFTLGPLALRDAGSEVHIEGRQIQFRSIEGHTLSGVLEGTGTMDATSSDPHYSFDVQLLHANVAGLASVWHEPPLSGTVSASAHLELSGYSPEGLAQSAKGTFHWDWTQGATTLVPAVLTRFDHWSADGAIRNRQLVLDQSSISRGPLRQTVSGTIAFDRNSNLTVADHEEPAHVARAAQSAP